MKGDYVLLMKLSAPRVVRVGALGELLFKEGYYAYVGSGRGSLEARLERHRRADKKMRWHIDYVLPWVELIDILYALGPQRRECLIARRLVSALEAIPHFGASDCRCMSHLVFSRVLKILRAEVENAFRSLKSEARRFRTRLR